MGKTKVRSQNYDDKLLQMLQYVILSHIYEQEMLNNPPPPTILAKAKTDSVSSKFHWGEEVKGLKATDFCFEIFGCNILDPDIC